MYQARYPSPAHLLLLPPYIIVLLLLLLLLPCISLQTREMAVSSLSTFQKGAQRSAFQAAAEKVLREKFKKEDASDLLKLCLHDAATYDADSKTGGFDGSIIINR